MINCTSGGPSSFITWSESTFSTTTGSFYGMGTISSHLCFSSGQTYVAANANPTMKLSNGGQLTTTSFNAGSDYRIKENVQPLDEDAIVDNLRPVTYINKNSGKQDIGLIAHELQEHYPFLVSGEKDGKEMQSVNYTGLIGVLIKEIQELKTTVKELKTRVTILESNKIK